MGVDIAVDANGTEYVLELNANASIYDFRNLPIERKRAVGKKIADFALWLYEEENRR